MKDLLENEFITRYNRNPENPVQVFVIAKSTQDKLFELKDDDKDIICNDLGIARYANPNQIIVNVINYESFINSLPQRVQSSFTKRCDLIVYTADKGHFLLNELTNTETKLLYEHETYGIKTEGKISKAKQQLKLSLENLLNVSEIKKYTENFAFKRCCFFSKQENNAPKEITAVENFNIFNTLSFNGILIGNQMSNSDIEGLGFEYWEFYGNQTYLLQEVSILKTLAEQLIQLSAKEVKDITEILKSQ